MSSASTSRCIRGDDDEFDWEAAVREIDVSCRVTSEKSDPVSNINNPDNIFNLSPVQEIHRKRKCNRNSASISSSRQSTLDRFIGVSSSIVNRYKDKAEFSERSQQVKFNIHNSGDKNCRFTEVEDMEIFSGSVKIDTDAAKTWIYPANVPHRDYQFSITKTALFSNTLVVLPTGLGKTLIAATVMYNYFRWFPEGKIVFAAPSRPLVTQQIEACHKLVGIPQEWSIDLTGQTSPDERASLWKDKRVFFVTPHVLANDIHSGSCLVNRLVCLVIDEAHRASGNYSYCVAVRELINVRLQLRILALTATPGCTQQTIQHVIDNLQISTLEYRNESDHDVLPYVHERKIELIEVPMGDEAVEINNMLLEIAQSFAARLCSFGVLERRDFQMLSPCDLLNSRDKFRQEPPPDLPNVKYGDIEGYFGVLITFYHLRKLLSSHGIRPAFEMLHEKLEQRSFARFMSTNEVILKAKLLMKKTVSHGAPSPKLAKMLNVLIDHFKVKDPQNSRVIIFSNFRGSVRDIMNALTNIGQFVRATEFIGQSSGKTKGQSQKVQQAVLQKFRTGGYNVIVATSIGEEGLDIMEVDLVICFDANISPVRMIQRMGRTGRKHKGRVVVLACEGSEMKGYMRKKVNSKSMNKQMTNGGVNNFHFHHSPRMVPHIFRPDVQFLHMSIEQFVPRGKNVKDVDHISAPSHKTKAETDILAKYFTYAVDSWKPSLIAFPHFQAFPNRVNEVPHSSRTSMLIDTMQYLQGLSFSRNNKILNEDEDVLDPQPNAEVDIARKDPVKVRTSYNLWGRKSAEEHLRTMVTEIEIEEIPITKEMHVEDFDHQKSCTHTFLFGAEFISIDDLGNVLILSIPQLPRQSHFKGMNIDDKVKGINNDSIVSACQWMHDSDNHEENTVLEVDNASLNSKSLQVTSSKPKEMDISCEDYKVAYDRIPMLLADVSNNDDLKESELSPRLTNFIKSGIVPESPMSNGGKRNLDTDNLMVSGHVPFPPFQTGISTASRKHEDKAIQGGTFSIANDPYLAHDDIIIPELNLNKNAPRTCMSPAPVAKKTHTPFAKDPNSSSSERWLVDSGGKSEMVEQQCKFRRLCKRNDLNREVPPESKKPTGLKRKKAKDVSVYIHEEAEVSSEFIVSDDEEDEQTSSSYDDSFIDDGVHPTSADTQPGFSRVDMMAVYRRSLLSQSPFQRLSNFSTNLSPNSVVQSITINESEASSGTKHDKTLQTGLDTTAKTSQHTCQMITTEINNQCRQETRKRKSSSFLTQSVRMVNLDTEFSILSEAVCHNSFFQLQVDRMEEKIDVFEDDRFYEGIDLDAVEVEAAKLLNCKPEYSTQKIKRTEASPQNLGILGSPSFDLGV